jgi:hypothetical protein
MVSDAEVIAAGADKIAGSLKTKLDAALDPKSEKKKVRSVGCFITNYL